MLLPLLAKLDFSAPTPIIIALIVIAVALLFIRFIIKSAITLVKIAIIVIIGLAVYFGVMWLMSLF